MSHKKGVLKICSKFIGEHPYQSVISINLQSNFIEIVLRHGCSPVNLLHIFRITSPKNTFGGGYFWRAPGDCAVLSVFPIGSEILH